LTRELLIFDADGVFLDERPYWDAALATAFTANDLPVPTGSDWRQLTDTAFGPLGLHRVTKRRGCNSNWDLGAVLTRALGDLAGREAFQAEINNRNWNEAVLALWRSAEDLWQRPANQEPAPDDGHVDPLLGFGIQRYGSFFAAMRDAYQKILLSDPEQRDSPGPWRLRESFDVVTLTLSICRASGFELWVCTGRNRDETLVPISLLGLDEFFKPDRLVSADEVSQAEKELGVPSLGKPHWFPAACAALGYAEACDLVRQGTLHAAPGGTAVFVGDGLADFQCVSSARAVGIPIQYVHVRSGVTDTEQEAPIARAPFTLGFIDGLAELSAALQRADRSIKP
jgi:phosphoglycolate phosphatase-like HAD superfamily hydrolase